jgi:hypothetical protein
MALKAHIAGFRLSLVQKYRARLFIFAAKNDTKCKPVLQRFNKMLKYIAYLVLLASLALPTHALSQTNPGCAYGDLELSRSLEANQTAVRTITVCPGALAEICVRVDDDYQISVDIDSSGASIVKRVCRKVTRRSCQEVPIRLSNPNSAAVNFTMQCEKQ